MHTVLRCSSDGNHVSGVQVDSEELETVEELKTYGAVAPERFGRSIEC